MEQIENKEAEKTAASSVIAFLLPCYKTPLLTSDLLHTAKQSEQYDKRCKFVLLLDRYDPFQEDYRKLVDAMYAEGMNIGSFTFNGALYNAKVNRLATIIDATTVCCIDSKHLPYSTSSLGNFADCIVAWLSSSLDAMRVGVLSEVASDNAFCRFPVVTRAFIDRLGYLYHPLCRSAISAEWWIEMLAKELGILSLIPNAGAVESNTEGVEILGVSSEEDTEWSIQTLQQTLSDETEALSEYLLK